MYNNIIKINNNHTNSTTNNNTIIFFTKELTIYNNKEIPDLFKIKLLSSNQTQVKNQRQTQSQDKSKSTILFNNIKQTKLLTGLTTNEEMNEITFQASSITTLSEYRNKNWTYEKCQILVSSLIKQLNNLLNVNYSFYGYTPESILVINENIFLQISTEYLYPLNNNKITFHAPFTKSFFIAPEVRQVSILPSKVNYQCIYYSLAVIVTYLLQNTLFKNGDLFINPNPNPNKSTYPNFSESDLTQIKGTKLYWFLLRAFHEDPEKRKLIYI